MIIELAKAKARTSDHRDADVRKNFSTDAGLGVSRGLGSSASRQIRSLAGQFTSTASVVAAANSIRDYCLVPLAIVYTFSVPAFALQTKSEPGTAIQSWEAQTSETLGTQVPNVAVESPKDSTLSATTDSITNGSSTSDSLAIDWEQNWPYFLGGLFAIAAVTYFMLPTRRIKYEDDFADEPIPVSGEAAIFKKTTRFRAAESSPSNPSVGRPHASQTQNDQATPGPEPTEIATPVLNSIVEPVGKPSVNDPANAASVKTLAPASSPTAEIPKPSKEPSTVERQLRSDLKKATAQINRDADRLQTQLAKIDSMNQSLEQAAESQKKEEKLKLDALDKLTQTEAKLNEVERTAAASAKRIEELETETTVTSKALENAEQRLHQDKKTIAGEVTDLRLQIEELQATHREAISNSASEIAQGKSDLASAESKISELEAEILKSKETAKIQLANLNKEKDAISNERNQLLTKLSELENSHELVLKKTSEKFENNESELRIANQTIAKLKADIEDVNQSLVQSENQKNEEVQLLNRELESATENLNELRGQYDQLVENSAEQSKSAQSDLNHAQQRIAEIEREKAQIEREKSKIESKKAQIEASLADAETNSRQLSTDAQLLRLENDRLAQVVQQHARTPAATGPTLEAMEDLRNQDSVVHIEKLKSKLLKQAQLRKQTEAMLAEAEQQRTELALALKDLKARL